MKLRRMPFWVMVAGATALLPRFALAWDPATTHAGLTERALASSTFHATLTHQLGRALGSLEPLHLDLGALAPNDGRSLKSRLDALDPAGGYRPSAEDFATASAWVRAGSVLAKTPPERGRHHFFEPRTRKGLDDGPGLSGAVHAARLTFDDGATVRDSATGQSFDLEGMSALDWLRSPQNDLGLMAFFDHWVLAVSAAQAPQRETSLAQALLALGGTLAVLEDAGQPAFVRNDFRGEFLARDSGSALERFVSDRYGSASLPAAPIAVSRLDMDSYFVAADGNGLAQLTQNRFFSAGTLPQDVRFVSGQKQSEIVDLVNRSLRFPEPKVTSLDLRQAGRTHYVVREGLRVLAYQRNANRVHFFLDQAVHADMARGLLSQVEGYAAGLVDHLLRAKLQIVVADNQAQVTVTGLASQAEPTFVAHLFAEDDAGVRTEIATQTLHGDAPSSIAIPKGARKVAAYLRGQDSAGAFVAAAEVRVP